MKKFGILFQVNQYDMNTDYEILDNINISKREYYLKDACLDPNILVFQAINHLLCEEVSSGLLFIKMDDNHYYNEATGLVFDVNKSFKRFVNPFADDFDFMLYESYASEFLEPFKKLKEEDDIIKAKAQYLLLRHKKNKESYNE